jgi:hypothetical protein
MDGADVEQKQRDGAERLPVFKDEQQPAADDCCADGDEAEIPNLFRIETDAAGEGHGQSESGENADGDQDAVGGDDERAELEEAGVHSGVYITGAFINGRDGWT